MVGLALAASDDPRRRKTLVTVSVVANLTLLGIFKYAGFFTESLAELLGLFGIELSPFTRTVVLPVGISFYTFQTLSYTIEIYRGRLQPTRHSAMRSLASLLRSCASPPPPAVDWAACHTSLLFRKETRPEDPSAPSTCCRRSRRRASSPGRRSTRGRGSSCGGSSRRP